MKIHANKGVRRNKKPLQNMVYRVQVISDSDLNCETNLNENTIYGVGKVRVTLSLQRQRLNYWSPSYTLNLIKGVASDKQFAKLLNALRSGLVEYDVIVQRRIDGKNV